MSQSQRDFYYLVDCWVYELFPFDIISEDYLKCVFNSIRSLVETIIAITEGMIMPAKLATQQELHRLIEYCIREYIEGKTNDIDKCIRAGPVQVKPNPVTIPKPTILKNLPIPTQ